jgi:hypothetical protein
MQAGPQKLKPGNFSIGFDFVVAGPSVSLGALSRVSANIMLNLIVADHFTH